MSSSGFDQAGGEGGRQDVDQEMTDVPAQNDTQEYIPSQQYGHTVARFQPAPDLFPLSSPPPPSPPPPPPPPAPAAPPAPPPTTQTAQTAQTSPNTTPAPANISIPELTQSSTVSSGGKKKGQATVKKNPKRPRGGPRGGRKANPKKKQGATATASSTTAKGASDEAQLASGSEDEVGSDHGPYCICRGPDDHRFMIGCDVCEDWFHGECVNIAKDVGENLIERFVCPNCTDTSHNIQTLFKKTCSYRNCFKPARLYGAPDSRSVFCSDEHRQLWWEKMISALPKKSSEKPFMRNALTQDEFTALLSGDLFQVDEKESTWRVTNRLFNPPQDEDESTEAHTTLPAGLLTAEEEYLIQTSAAERYKMGEEIVLCQKMLQLLDMASEHRKELIQAKKFDDSACGYDSRLDTVGVQAPFAHWLSQEEGMEVFRAGTLAHGVILVGDDKNICDKKRCKPHQGWFAIHSRDVRYQMKLLAADAKKQLNREREIREAALERRLRNAREGNRVSYHDQEGNIIESR